MCCFSGPVREVEDTKIFARNAEDNRQIIVYQMEYSSRDDVAMILPIPTPVAAPVDAVRFINLEKYEDFFKDMKRGFPEPVMRGMMSFAAAGGGHNYLEVHSVGAFEASFVPTRAHFLKLDPRFRMPMEVWDKLPSISDFGSVVFKLKKGSGKVHPMAFSFPKREGYGKRLFFPTIHVHDGKVESKAQFDHVLYFQAPFYGNGLYDPCTPDPVRAFVDIEKAQGTVDPELHAWKREIHGEHWNTNTTIAITLEERAAQPTAG